MNAPGHFTPGRVAMFLRTHGWESDYRQVPMAPVPEDRGCVQGTYYAPITVEAWSKKGLHGLGNLRWQDATLIELVEMTTEGT